MTDQKDVERNCPECDGTGQDRGMHPVRLGERNEFSSLHEMWRIGEGERGRRPMIPVASEETAVSGEIRPATVEDAAAIQAIYAPIVAETVISFEEEPPTVDEMAARIVATLVGHPYLIATRDHQVVGYAYAGAHRSRSAYRFSADVTIYVSRNACRTGIGRALYAALLADLSRRGFHAAFAGIALPNAASVGLHEAMGFEALGIYREVGFKFGRWHDVGWWQRML